MKRINFEAPVMELIALGAEDIICASPAPEKDPHFVKGTNATVHLGQKNFPDVNFDYTGD